MSEQPKKISDLAILGFNLLVFGIYTAICLSGGNLDGGATAFFISIFQFVVCTIVSLVMRRWSWFLAGIITLVIGFGTCVNNFHMGHM